MTQNWDVLPEARTGILTDTTIPIERGILPGATAAMDPAPQATFEVVARHQSGAPGSYWNVALSTSTGAVVAWVAIPETAATFSVRTASFSWPSADVELDEVRLTRSFGANVPGTLDIKKATLRLVQTGTIAKTQARFPMGARTEAITSSSWTDLSDGASYLYPADYQEDGTGPYHPAFDPAPSVKLRASGTPCGLQVRLVKAIIDANGEETGIAAVANSEIELTNAGGSVYSSVLSLVKGGVYRPQVRKVSCSGAAPTGTITSIDLELSQSSSHPDGIARTVGYYPSLSDGVDVDLTNQNVPLNFRFRAPQRNVPKATGAWAVSAKRVTGTGSYSVGLYNHTRASQVALSAPILDYTIGGSAPFDFEVAEVDSLPAAGDELDTVVSPAAGTTVHAWSSYLQVNYRLADLDAPVLTVPFSATQTHISPGVSPGAKDSVTFSATLWDFSATDWDVEVRSASGTLVATGSGSAAAQTAAPISWTWDGRDSSGSVVADGTYTARLIATDLPGNVNDAATTTVVVDTVAPVVSNYGLDPSTVDV
ncbi:MAG TPA: FlgD immunoglobulin-like domain containing protein, partial [Actinomycetota bacterium]